MIGNVDTAQPTLVDHVVDHVFRCIMSGRYAPGCRITEEQIAGEMQVSRTPVREAAKRLADLGLLVIRPRSGLVVAQVDERDVQEVKVLREDLEALAIRLAFPKIGPAELARLNAIQDRCEELVEAGEDRMAVFRQDSRLHMALGELSGNRHLLDVLHRLDIKVLLCRMFLCQSMEKIAANVRFHRSILDALAAGDVEQAESLMRRHIANT